MDAMDIQAKDAAANVKPAPLEPGINSAESHTLLRYAPLNENLIAFFVDWEHVPSRTCYQMYPDGKWDVVIQGIPRKTPTFCMPFPIVKQMAREMDIKLNPELHPSVDPKGSFNKISEVREAVSLMRDGNIYKTLAKNLLKSMTELIECEDATQTKEQPATNV